MSRLLKAREIFVLLTTLLLVACTGNQTATALPEQVDMYYFYDEICGSCETTENFDRIVQEQLIPVQGTYPYTVYRYNVYHESGKSALEDLCGRMELDKSSLQYPLLILGGYVIQGLDNIEKNLQETYLVAGEDLFFNRYMYNPAERKTGSALFHDYKVEKNAVTLVYFYRIICEECNRTKPLIDAIPDTIAIDGRWLSVDVVRVNTRSGNNRERAAAFFEYYQVPDEKRMVPIVFFSNAYLAGFDEISDGLQNTLLESATAEFDYPSYRPQH